mmetsp:Transcript_62622/g.198284  ORF Transcript_62622/g.198284 Transcript_62622/m.198284 type:complete len:214 (-) Transcript_62622:49-690(-)
MNRSRLSGARATSPEMRTCCSTLRSAREAVAAMASQKPAQWKSGSYPLARARPPTTGTRHTYVRGDSGGSWKRRAIPAVKRGVVADTVCSKLTGIYLACHIPHTTPPARTAASSPIFASCPAEAIPCLGAIPNPSTAALARTVVIAMCMVVRNTGKWNPYLTTSTCPAARQHSGGTASAKRGAHSPHPCRGGGYDTRGDCHAGMGGQPRAALA